MLSFIRRLTMIVGAGLLVLCPNPAHAQRFIRPVTPRTRFVNPRMIRTVNPVARELQTRRIVQTASQPFPPTGNFTRFAVPSAFPTTGSFPTIFPGSFGGLGGYGGGYGGYGYGGYGGGGAAESLLSTFLSGLMSSGNTSYTASPSRDYTSGGADSGESKGNGTSNYLDPRNDRAHEEYRLPGQSDQVIQEPAEREHLQPAMTEIYSGDALNDLLVQPRRQPRDEDAGKSETPIVLDEESLKHIHVTRGAGSLALIKNDGALTWPVALSGQEFKADRERVTALVRDALDQARSRGAVANKTPADLRLERDALKERLRRSSDHLEPQAYREAIVFLKNLDDTIRALGQPDVKDFVTGKYDLKARTVPELVNFMTSSGLQFARALPGEEGDYLTLYRALDEYDRAVNR
jgi:hypothetical protein